MHQVIEWLRLYCELSQNKSMKETESIIKIDSYKHKLPWTASDLIKKPLRWYLWRTSKGTASPTRIDKNIRLNFESCILQPYKSR